MSVFRDGILTGRRALVTGGGSGICRGIAVEYARLGAKVALVGRRQDRLDAVKAEIEAAGGEALALAADVRDVGAVERAVSRTCDAFSGLDVVVNGAAGNFLAPVASLSPNGFGTVVDIDLKGTYHVCKAAFPALMAAGGDRLVLQISATLHYRGVPLQAHAGAAKAGVDALTKHLAVEWGSAGIRVNGIAPGPIGDTEGMARLAPGDLSRKMERQIPLGRFGTIQEIADMAVFLASPAASYVTGATFVVDGGAWLTMAGLLDR